MVHSVYTKNPKLTRDRAVLEKIFFRLDFAAEIDYNITVLYEISRCVGMADEGDSKSLVLITRVGSTPTTGIKRKPSSLSGGLSFYLRRVSGSNSTTLHSRGAISPAGCCSVRGRPPPPALQAARNRKVLGCFSFYPLTSGPSSHVCLHRETADDVLEGVINAELKKGIGAFQGSKGYGRFRCFFVMQKRDVFVDRLLQFIKQGTGKEGCQRDSKGTGTCAVCYTQMRNCKGAYGSTKQKSIPHSENGGLWAKSSVIPADLTLFYPS